MSMGGGGGSPKKHIVGKWFSPQIPAGSTLTVKLSGTPLLGGFSDVAGFSATALESSVVADLPADVFVPADVLGAIYAAKRLDVWIDTGHRVQDWAEQQGIAGASWLDPESDALRVPAEIADEDVPPFVRRWLADVPEMEAIIADLVTPA